VRRYLLVAAALLVVAVGAAWWHFAGREYVVRFGQAQIHEQLDRRFPISKSLLLLQVDLEHPRVTLHEGSSRVSLGLDVTLNIRVDNESRPLGGSADVDAGIRYDPADGTFHLTDPVVRQLQVQGIPERFHAAAMKLVAKAFTEFVEREPVYRLKTTDIKQATARLLLKSVVVENNELVITLGI
jgi:hypothetical protein